jgi:predicted transcriptional regulator
VGKLIDITDKLLEAKAKSMVERGARNERELTKQDILICLSCDPFASARDISDQLWEDFNTAGDLLVRKMLREMVEEGLVEYKRGRGYCLLPPAQWALDSIFKTEVTDE